MKINRRSIRKMILKEMAGMLGTGHNSLSFEKISHIHRFVELAALNGAHWMFPEGVDHDTYTTLNALFVTRISRIDSNDLEALQEYADIVKNIQGADLDSINQTLNR